MGKGDSYKNDGAAHLKFLKNFLNGTRILFGRHGLIIFLHLRGTNNIILSNTRHILSYISAQLTLKGNAIVLTAP